MRAIRWILKVDPTQRPNVEDLVNLPHVSMRLREKALKRNIVSVKKKEDEVKRKEKLLLDKEQEL
jgi:hypothetical protein